MKHPYDFFAQISILKILENLLYYASILFQKLLSNRNYSQTSKQTRYQKFVCYVLSIFIIWYCQRKNNQFYISFNFFLFCYTKLHIQNCIACSTKKKAPPRASNNFQAQKAILIYIFHIYTHIELMLLYQ